MMLQVLRGLRDLEGVVGSFALDETGALLEKDLPAVYHDDVLLETGPRIVRVCEAIEHGGEALDSLVLRFADHKLHIRRSRGGLLCVIASADSNPPALRMALALVARRLGSVSAPPTPTKPPPASAEAPARDTAPPAAPAKVRTYRGLPIR
ncbi:MAG: hypothetical protein QM756_27230 [Polyangiaceae bacterium]